MVHEESHPNQTNAVSLDLPGSSRQFNTPKQVRNSLRTANTMIGLGALLLVLGTGNILYGHYKSIYYQELLGSFREEQKLQRPQAQIARNRIRKNQVLMSLTSQVEDRKRSAEMDLEHARNLTARIDYYRFSLLGGKCFLALAGVCFALSLLFTRSDIS